MLFVRIGFQQRLVMLACAALFSVTAAQAQDVKKLEAEAGQLIQKKQFKQAIQVYKKVTSLAPSNQSAWYNMGVLSYQTGNPEGVRWAMAKAYRLNPSNEQGKNALNLLTAAMQQAGKSGNAAELKKYAATLEGLNPADPNPHFALGVAAMQGKSYDEAEARFGKVTVLSPKDSSAWINLGLARLNQKNLKGAREAFSRAAEVDPKNPVPRRMLASAAEQAGDTKGALSAYQALLGQTPRDVQSRLAYAGLLDKQGNVKEALAQYEIAAKHDPRSFAALANLGRTRFMSGDYKGAEKAFASAARVNPKSGMAHANLALSKLYTGDVNGAEAAYKKAVAVEPRSPSGYEGLAYVYEQRNKLPEAAAQIEKAISLTPKDGQGALTERMARLQERLGKTDRAVELWTRRTKESKDAAPWREIARIESARGNHDEAAQAYEKAYAADPKSTADILAAARMWGQAKQTDKAVASFDKAKDADPKDLQPYFAAAVLYSNEAAAEAPDKRDYSKALAEYDAAEKIDPKNVQIYQGRARLYENQEKYDLAIAEYKKIEDQGTEDPNMLANIGRLLDKAGKKDEAIADYRRVAEKFPKDARIQMTLGAALETQGNHEGAIAAYEEAYKRQPEQLYALQQIAEIQTKANKPAEAKAAWLRLAEIAPAGSPALAKLKDIYKAENKTDDYLKLLAGYVEKQPKTGAPPYDQFLDAYAEAGRADEGLAKIQELKAKDPKADLAVTEAKAMRLTGKNTEAVRALSALMNDRGKDPAVHRELGLAYRGLNNTERTTAHLKKSIELMPWDASAHMALGEVYEAAGNKTEALNAYRQAAAFGDPKATAAVERLEPKPAPAPAPETQTPPETAPAAPEPAPAP